uniref:GATA transcription factor 7-like n=1 Tax=Erigeron canadensis TaxID=72917 RepID=UPI001CB8FBF3|nr:GATA transcription factor 7-like [Erigeron canadensis]XP_043605972.1 GATA transcription factor 7-like [Erigeron canadensis]
MECIAARALKSSFLSEIMGLNSTQQQQQQQLDDFWCVTGINNISGEEFSVDDLLDLSDKDFSISGDGSSEEDFSSVSSPDFDILSTNSSSSGELVSLTGDNLPAPVDDMESLEWLSKIVDDSLSEHPILNPAVNLKDRTGLNRFEPVVMVTTQTFTVLGLPYQVPRKSRTKRSRKAGRVWSNASRSLTESCSSSSSSHESSLTSPMLFRNPVYYIDFFDTKPAAKKQRKSPGYQTGPGVNESLSQRRCTHCQVQKTPQWRTGPLGPKTLCNACGVRFKSGRLYPEYRPACSPTFLGAVHSNSHRKVLEIRKKKETEVETGMNIPIEIGSS